MTQHYSAQELLSLNNATENYRLPLATWNILKELGICNPKPTLRGTRGGRNRSRHIRVLYSSSYRKHRHRKGLHPENLITVTTTRQLPKRPGRSLQLALLNARSVRNKAADITEYVVSSGIDVCLLTETWLKPQDAVARAELKPSGYDFKDCPRPSDRAGGGIGVMYKSGLRCKVVSSGEHKSFEFVNYKFDYDKVILDVHVIYRPPYSARHPVTTATFFTEIEDYLSTAVETSNSLILAGDYNIHVDTVADPDAKIFQDLLKTYNLQQHVNTPTHMSGHCLDLIISRSNQEVKITQPVADYLVSDHMAVHCYLSVPRPPLKESTVTYRKLRNIDHASFSSDLKDVASKLVCTTDINKLAEDYNDKLRIVLDHHAPLSSKTIIERPTVPWFDNELKVLKNKRKKAERSWKKMKSEATLQAYQATRNLYVNTLNAKRTAHFTSLISAAGNDAKKLFSVVNALCDKGRNSPLPAHDSEAALANQFGTFFQDKISAIQEAIGPRAPPIINTRAGPELHSFSALSEDEVSKLVSKSKTASCSLDPVPTKLVKEHMDDLLPVLTHIINLSLSTGTFPEIWKNAVVVPLLKKDGLDLIPKNFRPVSNLQYISKLVEKAVVYQLFHHMDDNFPLPSCQSAYRTGHSTETALIKVQSDILVNMDNQKLTQLIMIDLSAAFDTVDHQLLCDTMHTSFGVSSQALQWISSYLRPRSQQVIIGSVLSDNFSLEQGVPQGSCLGPVMFTMYSSSIFSVTEKHNKECHGYADDHQLYDAIDPVEVGPAISAMEECVTDIKSWMQAMRLKMNDAKTEYMLIGTKRQLAKCETTSITIGDNVIQASDSIRDLGAYLDKHMSMEVHIKKKCQAAYAQLYNIAKIRKFLSDHDAEILIHALVHSHLDYCNALLTGLPKYLIRKLQLVQNSAARVLCRASKRDHITPILKSLHWLPVAFRIKFKVCVIVHKALYGSGPVYIKEMLKVKLADYHLRSSDAPTLIVPKTKCKTLGDRAFTAAAPRQWNALPNQLRSIQNIDLFQRHLKTHFFSQAFD